ncbi:MAG TPA: tetratricopeptide repeat protein [Candidatus Dormibacteraeota bacterium]|nr:tetratricopeptide repeat protein [Candidatus Dormibacteraeota bacterium]
MNRPAARYFLLACTSLWSTHMRAQSADARLEEIKARTTENAARAAGVPQQLFSTIALSTHSEEARKFLELALDKYENVLREDAVVHAQHATEKDPQFALGYAMLSFASRRGIPNSGALAKAKSLLPGAAPDEQLLVRWMTSVQDRDLLPAITSMNDLLKRFPRNKHVVYLTAAWLYSQQDYDRSLKMLETVRQLDPDFAPALNMLGYGYIETGDPDPGKAVATLKRYAELQPGSPNPEDSLGEVLRYAGDDAGALQHFGAALQIDPTFYTSHLGIGDTLTLMGEYEDARQQYDKAIKVSETPRDLLHAEYQKALVSFWQGQTSTGREALSGLAQKAAAEKQPYAYFEIGLGSAMLAPTFVDELHELRVLEVAFQNPMDGMNESDRNVAVADILREQVRVAAFHGFSQPVQEAIKKLEEFARQSSDLIVKNHYECARGYLLARHGDFANAADELAMDPQSPLAIQELVTVQEKLGNVPAAAAARKRMKYQRAASVEWYLASHNRSATMDAASK